MAPAFGDPSVFQYDYLVELIEPVEVTVAALDAAGNRVPGCGELGPLLQLWCAKTKKFARRGGQRMRKCVIGCALVLLMVLAAAVGVVTPQHSAVAASCQPALSRLTLQPSTVPGGAPSKVTAILNCATPKALTISLRGFAGVTVPAALQVAAGKTAASGTIKTATTKTTRHGTIAATLGPVRKTAALTVAPTPKICTTPVLASFSLPALSYVGAHPVAAIKLSCAAAGTVRLTVRSSSKYLPIPATVSIYKYYAAATVPLTPKAYQLGQYHATVYVRYGTRTLTRTITIDPGLASVSMTGGAGSPEPDFVSFDVTLTGYAPAGGLTVKISSSNSAVTIPASMTFQNGALRKIIGATTVQQVTQNTKVTLSATLGGRTLSASIVLVPPWNNQDTLALSAWAGPRPVYGSEYELHYWVKLSNPAPDGGLTVTISTPDPNVLQLFNTPVDFSAGLAQQDFWLSVANVTSPVHTEIDASVDGVTASIPVTVEPGLASITVPASIIGGASSTGTVNLAGPVDIATTVDLSCACLSHPGVLTVPPSVTIPAGQSSATFPITTVQVTSESSVNLGALLGDSQLLSGIINVTP